MGKKRPHPAKRPRAQAPAASPAGGPALPGELELALGAAVFTSDVVLPHLLHVAVARCPHPRARVVALDVAAAQKVLGVRAVRALREVGSEIARLGEEVVLIAAEGRSQARDALGQVRLDFEALPPVVGPALSAQVPADDAFGAPSREGEPEPVLGGAAFRQREVYGWERQSLAEWEAHAFVCEPVGDGLHVWAASEDPLGLAAELAAALHLPPGRVEVVARHVGAIFGGRRGLDPIDLACARLALELKAPLRLVFDRLSELVVGGHRGASFAEIEMGADKDGHVTAWRSRSWSAGPAAPPLPYLFQAKHRSSRHAAVPAAQPEPPQKPERPVAREEAPAAAAYFAGCALDDLAALMGQSPLDVLPLNYSLADPYGERFAALLQEAAAEVGWKNRWHPRGDSTEGPVKRGMGLGFGLWVDPAGAPNLAAVTAPSPPGMSAPAAPVPEGPAGPVKPELPPEPVAAPPGGAQAAPAQSVTPATPAGGVEPQPESSAAPGGAEEPSGRPVPANPAAAAPQEPPSGSAEAVPTGVPPAPGAALPVTAPQPAPANGVPPASGTLALVVAEVAVDRQTGIVAVERVCVAGEVGREAPEAAKRLAAAALSRGAVQGLSLALFEEGDGGRIAGACEVGRFAARLVEVRGLPPAGAPAASLAARFAAPAAVANAVANALGLRLSVLPITPERILAALAPPAPKPAPAAPAPSPTPPAAPDAKAPAPPSSPDAKPPASPPAAAAKPATGEGAAPGATPAAPPPAATPAAPPSPPPPPEGAAPATPPPDPAIPPPGRKGGR